MVTVEVSAWTLAKLSMVGSDVELWWYGGPGKWTCLGFWTVLAAGVDGVLVVGSEFDGVRVVEADAGYCIGQGVFI